MSRRGGHRDQNVPGGQEESGVEEVPEPAAQGKDPAAVSLGRRGGLKGGPARARKLSPQQRTEIARKAAAARWGNPHR